MKKQTKNFVIKQQNLEFQRKELFCSYNTTASNVETLKIFLTAAMSNIRGFFSKIVQSIFLFYFSVSIRLSISKHSKQRIEKQKKISKDF